MIIEKASLLRLALPLVLLLTACGSGAMPTLGVSDQPTFVYVYTEN